MKKLFIVLIMMFAYAGSCFSQDRILTMAGEEIFAKIKEIDTAEVRYVLAVIDSVTKKTSYATEMQKMKRSEIFMIKYENGTKDVFTQNLPAEKKIPETNTNYVEVRSNKGLFAQGRHDASSYDGTTPFLIGGLCGITLIYGVVPAVIVAAVPPKPKYENATDHTLLNNPSYNAGFKSKAHGRKALNIAAGFAAGLALDIAAVIALSDW